ncbi:tudor domain-containing protein 3-like [Ptychodera flava]|uniref:tudor domain-containing protein 3-like n=1 Tax=Ptychodera flava TaxID=63121 RepID=UPI00396A91DA
MHFALKAHAHGNMAELKLQKLGWHLSKDGLEECSTAEGSNSQNVDGIVKAALNTDLRQIGAAFFPTDINRGKIEYVKGPCVLQIQKLRNVGAPKANEESQHAPRMFRVHLSDGHITCSGVEVSRIDKLSLSTPPGTKVKLTGNIPVRNGFLLLDKDNTTVLGGRVEKLVTKWELARSLAQHSRNYEGREGGPPPWIPFGQKRGPVNREKSNIRDFKSLDTHKDHNEQDKEFEEQRKAVIEATLQEGKSKTFGGGSTAAQNLQKEKESQKRSGGSTGSSHVTGSSTSSAGIYRELSSGVDDKALKKLMDMGFDRDKSISALKEHSGDVDGAIHAILQGQQGQQKYSSGGRQRSGDYGNSSSGGSGGAGGGRQRSGGRGRSGRGKGRGRGGQDDEDAGDMPSRPSGPTTLFDFLETQLGTVSEKENTPSDTTNTKQYHNRYDEWQDDPKPYKDRRQQGDRRNYDHQPKSVREAGIVFVHGEKDNRRSNGPDHQRYQNERGPNQYQNQRRDNQYQRNQNDYRQDRSRQQREYGQQRERQNYDSRYSQSKDYAPRHEPKQNFHDRDQYDNRTDMRQGSGYNRQNRYNNPQDRDAGQHYRGEQRSDRDYRSAGESRGHDYRQRDRPDSGARSKQYHDLSRDGQQQQPLRNHWKKGEPCLAKYWEDNKMYPAQIYEVHPDLPTAVVHFTEYGNHEEVMLQDIKPMPALNSWAEEAGPHRRKYENFEGPMGETLEFRQGGGGSYKRRTQNYESHAERERRQPSRPQQQYYQPPAARK